MQYINIFEYISDNPQVTLTLMRYSNIINKNSTVESNNVHWKGFSANLMWQDKLRNDREQLHCIQIVSFHIEENYWNILICSNIYQSINEKGATWLKSQHYAFQCSSHVYLVHPQNLQPSVQAQMVSGKLIIKTSKYKRPIYFSQLFFIEPCDNWWGCVRYFAQRNQFLVLSHWQDSLTSAE